MATQGPTIWILPRIMAKLNMYIQVVDYEISGLGTVVRLGNDFLIDEIYLLKQKCRDAETTLDPKSVASFWMEYLEQGLEPTKLRFWWHSHVNMSTFWSGTDEATAERFGFGSVDYWLSVVGNKRGEYKARVDLFSPMRLTVDDLPFRVYISPQEHLRASLEAEVAEKVEYVPPEKTVYYTGGFWPPATPVVEGVTDDTATD